MHPLHGADHYKFWTLANQIRAENQKQVLPLHKQCLCSEIFPLTNLLLTL